MKMVEKFPESSEYNIDNNVARVFNWKNFFRNYFSGQKPIAKSDNISNSNDESLEKTDMEEKIDKAIDYAKNIAMDDSNWYWLWKHGNWEYDCSGLIWASMNAAWILDTKWSGGSGLSKELKKNWFKEIPYTGIKDLKKWDVVRRPGSHVEFYAWENQSIWAHSNKDRKRWDSSWKEIDIRNAESSYANRKPSIVIRHEDMNA